jgi:hypothetical protein
VCDFWPQCGCGTGDKCTINGLFERACTPIGASGVGELCTGVGDCDAETLCVGLDPGPGVYVCTQYCDDDSDCTDGDGALCVKSIPINATERQSICTQHCNPMDNAGCPAGTNCYVFATTYGPGGSECWGPPGTSTGTCAQSYQCAAGMMCDGFDNVCGFTCRRNLGNGDCPPPQICYGFVTPITIGTTEYGVCAS